jgi:hypothetical protein
MKTITEKAIEANLRLLNRKIHYWEERGITYFFQNKEWYERDNRTLEIYSEKILSNKQQTEEHGQ